MSKMYKSNQGLCVLSGKVKSISDDRTSVDVEYRKYDPVTKKATNLTKTISGLHDLDTLKVGQSVSAVGYDCGPNFQLVGNTFFHDNAVFEMNDIAVVSGRIQSVGLNDELDQDGNPKKKQDGTPKKPHYDIKVVVNDNGKETVHQIKTYNFVSKTDNKLVDNISDMAKRFEKFQSPETTPTFVTVVTNPGNSYEFEKNDGTIYYGCAHLGVRSIDQIFEYQLQRSQPNAEKEADEPEKEPEPAVPSEKSEANEPIAEISGIDEDFDLAFE